MSLENIHLRKLLKIFFLEPNRQTSELRADIRGEIDREGGGGGLGGGDFYGPFWSDVRLHVFNIRDLHDSVRARIDANPRRARLYPQLRDGFLQWWNDRRRWTNEPFQPIISPHVRHPLDGLGTVKVESILAVRDAGSADHFTYPYFSEEPVLGEEAGRLGLWLLREALPSVNDIRILDVIRGQPISSDRIALRGDERDSFRRRYGALLRRWHALWEEYRR